MHSECLTGQISLPLKSTDSDVVLTSVKKIQQFFRKWKNNHIASLKFQISSIRRHCAILIQKTFKAWQVRKAFSLIKRKNIIKWEHAGSRIQVKGNFTSPPWQESIDLKYLKPFNSYVTSVLTERNVPTGVYLLKFLVDGEWKCNGNIPLTIDEKGNLNNIFLISENNRLSRSMQLKSISHEVLPYEHIVRSNQHSPLLITRSYSNNMSPDHIHFCESASDSNIKLLMSASMVTKPRKKKNEKNESADAYFLNTFLQAFGVADGVGEWDSYGLNPSDFSKELIKNLEESMLHLWNEPDFLEQSAFSAYYSVKSFGSSTLLAGVLRDSMLHTISLGDSAFLVLRQRDFSNSFTVVYRSLEQQHSFNCPFQLTHLPSEDQYQSLIENGYARLVQLLKHKNKTHDSLVDAIQEIIPIRKGDVIVAGTDGIFDNLFDSEIIEIIEKNIGKRPEEFIKTVPDLLVNEALNKSWNNNCKTPFSKKAAKCGKKFVGGKLDDITVLVLLAVPI